jgi:hypothetical protein
VGPAVLGPAVLGPAGAVSLLAVSSIVIVVLTGHTGAKSHWQDFIKSSDKMITKKKHANLASRACSARPTPDQRQH